MARSKVYGGRELEQQLKKMAKQFPNATAIALYQEAMGIFEESQAQTPVDTGNLRQTGLLTVVRDGDGYKVLIGYGAAYALRMHEETKYDENRDQPGENEFESTRTTGKSKYLEDPFNAAMGGLAGRVSKRVEAILAGGKTPSAESLPDVKGRGGKEGGKK